MKLYARKLPKKGGAPRIAVILTHRCPDSAPRHGKGAGLHAAKCHSFSTLIHQRSCLLTVVECGTRNKVYPV